MALACNSRCCRRDQVTLLLASPSVHRRPSRMRSMSAAMPYFVMCRPTAQLASVSWAVARAALKPRGRAPYHSIRARLPVTPSSNPLPVVRRMPHQPYRLGEYARSNRWASSGKFVPPTEEPLNWQPIVKFGIISFAAVTAYVGYCTFESRRPPQRAADVEKVMEGHENEEWYSEAKELLTIAVRHIEVGKRSSALQYLRRVQKLMPDNDWIQWEMAIGYSFFVLDLQGRLKSPDDRDRVLVRAATDGIALWRAELNKVAEDDLEKQAWCRWHIALMAAELGKDDVVQYQLEILRKLPPLPNEDRYYAVVLDANAYNRTAMEMQERMAAFTLS